MSGKFQEGDKVRLRTGGPDMIVDWCDTTYNQYTCSYWDQKKQETSQQRYTEGSLEKMDDFDPGAVREKQAF
jgi:uncharacterized protein YodC (DUF2158 family)